MARGISEKSVSLRSVHGNKIYTPLGTPLDDTHSAEIGTESCRYRKRGPFPSHCHFVNLSVYRSKLVSERHDAVCA